MRSLQRASRRGHAVAAAIIALFAIVGPGRVSETSAAPPRVMKPEARAALDRGVAAYQKGDFTTASAALREAITIEPHPDLYYTLGQSERRAGRCDEAAEAYRAFLASNPPATEASLARDNMERCVPATPPPSLVAAPPTRPVVAVSPPTDDQTSDAGGENFGLVLWPTSGILLSAFGCVAFGVAEGTASDAQEAKTLGDFRSSEKATDGWRVTGVVSLVAGVGLMTSVLIYAAVITDAPEEKKRVSLHVGPGFVGVAGEL